jgi:hypothetical protein
LDQHSAEHLGDCLTACARVSFFNGDLNNVVAGAAVGILALIRWSMHQPGWRWLNLILGMWLVISPFVLFLSAAAMWNNVILGIIIAAFALTNTYSKVSAET